MNVNDFVIKFHKVVTEENITIYRDLFNNTVIEKSTINYWKEALSFYNKLDEKDRKILFKILRQVSIDTASNLFAIFDGVSFLEGQDDDLEIYFSKNKDEKINGDMQDMFLEYDEEVRKSEETREC